MFITIRIDDDKVRDFIESIYTPENYDEAYGVEQYGYHPEETWADKKQRIWRIFYIEMLKHNLNYRGQEYQKHKYFNDWCQGLPSIINTAEYYLGKDSAKKKLCELIGGNAEDIINEIIYRTVKEDEDKIF